ncbi:uncharacterized protein LOC105698829 [Orussus abietinus]|uniref:uncharacterized protein LOC105698829 n=1 Tax=Orussus abietinus TaxID=222816 RepID=UPI0006257F70|nr:uncharacterized protein LOC105698829 [Orussus abietinus]XP_023289810.1 uncharacterized protein LOC105698829 [Orussus abietinus]XP_023289811.1 uncharacterized protein LOC105698829 [Orussus abietinus]
MEGQKWSKSKQQRSKHIKDQHKKKPHAAVESTQPTKDLSSRTVAGKKLSKEDYDYRKSDKSQFEHLKRETEEIDERFGEQSHSAKHRLLVSNWNKYDNFDTDEEEQPKQDFQFLANENVSASNHFVFNYEKTWNFETPKYSEYFSLNTEWLSTVFDCIPFYHYVKVPETYFTDDQLTKIHNKAENAKKVYLTMLNNMENVDDSQKTENATVDNLVDSDGEVETLIIPQPVTPVEKDTKVADLEEDLDFLLTLEEPVKTTPIALSQSVHTPSSEDTRNYPGSSTKSIDLEKWLDSVLDD